ncbi:hypothetical protein BKA70DRAFT_1398639 [Coprinopsis sp. MPI-PUGE-AT-0042]|nr:hypothetical protein BKA70DRAFT_1398639 [Coprinopsis sp. MPI-PUGE-AT-0042]
MSDSDRLDAFTFTFSLNDSSTSFRGSDGRTGTRQESQARSTPTPVLPASVSTRDGAERPLKRSRRATEREESVKRPVGRPRRRPLDEGLAVEFGSFNVPGTSRSHSAQAMGSTASSSAARVVPLAPIFNRNTVAPLALHASTSATLPQPAPTATPPNTPVVLRKDENLHDLDPDDEADGSGEGGGDESDEEGDEEDPAHDNIGSDSDESEGSTELPSSASQEKPAAKAKNYRVQRQRQPWLASIIFPPQILLVSKSFVLVPLAELYHVTSTPLQPSIFPLGSSGSHQGALSQLQT